MTATRKTIQQDLVFNAVNSLRNHATPDDVYEEILKSYKTISKATVYRNLNQLAESGKIRKVSVPNGADRFDHQIDNHYHAQCTICGKVIDVTLKYFSNLEEKVENTDGFMLLGHDIIFSGFCEDCQKNMSIPEQSNPQT